MNPAKTWGAAGVCVVTILSAALIAVVFEAMHPLSPFFDDDEGAEATADAEVVRAEAPEVESAAAPSKPVGVHADAEAVRQAVARLTDIVQQRRKFAKKAPTIAPATPVDGPCTAEVLPEALVRQAVAEGLTRIGQGVQKLRKPVRDAKQLLKWALGVGRKRGQLAAG
jgi:hypothetical protein